MRDVLKVELQRLVDEMNADAALAAEWTDPQLRVFTNADELAGVVVDLVKAVAPRSLAGEWLWDWRGLLEDLHDVRGGPGRDAGEDRAGEGLRVGGASAASVPVAAAAARGDDMIGLLTGLIRRSRPGPAATCAVCGISDWLRHDHGAYGYGYADGKAKAHDELRVGFWSGHGRGCGCEPYQTVRSVTATLEGGPPLA